VIAGLPRALAQGSVLLVGGGSEDYNDWSDKPYRWLVQQAPNRRVAILHYSTTSSWLVSYFKSLGATSDTSFAIPSTASANDSSNYRAILACDGVFLRGGDQWQYISKWKGTLVERAIREVYQRGGVVGGTSAGMAVLTRVIFDARVTSVDPRAALRNPLASGITFTEDFLGLVPGVLGDTHFYERGRIGRLLAMLAVFKAQTGREIAGIGVDYNTALAIGPTVTGEVMGAGTVTVLRWKPETIFRVEPSTSLSISGMSLDQLTDGFRVSLPDGLILPPSTATAYLPKPYRETGSTLVLDGSNAESDWFSGSGSFARFAEFFTAGTDTVGIVSSPSVTSAAITVATALSQRNIPSRQLWLDAGRKDDPVVAQGFSGCKGLVFAGNSPDSLAGYLDSTTPVGRVFLARVRAHAPLLYLGNDTKLVSDTVVVGTEAHAYAAYYGTMHLARGQGIAAGFALMPRAYENADSIDNRFSGLFWGLAKSSASSGLLLDAGTYLTLRDGRGTVTGLTPAIHVDARQVRLIDFPTWRDPGKANPRQNAALVGAAINVVRDGETFSLVDGSVTGIRAEPGLPAGFNLEQNYPNPFNPTTTVKFQIPNTPPASVTPERRAGKFQSSATSSGSVSLKIYDLLGREVAVLVNESLPAGTHTVRFDGSRLASGVYIYRLQAGTIAQSRTMILLR
jgi:cyanophycinase